MLYSFFSKNTFSYLAKPNMKLIYKLKIYKLIYKLKIYKLKNLQIDLQTEDLQTENLQTDLQAEDLQTEDL